MKKEQTEKEDGRYLIFYSFEVESKTETADSDQIETSQDDNTPGS
ncbi:MAG TPA: hypothetical protein VFC63_11450 [Blastocatellia bacterium]|nr:hypothetical protein [Blastocatellia bacterium]